MRDNDHDGVDNQHNDVGTEVGHKVHNGAATGKDRNDTDTEAGFSLSGCTRVHHSLWFRAITD